MGRQKPDTHRGKSRDVGHIRATNITAPEAANRSAS
jgi:hypothetical protein